MRTTSALSDARKPPDHDAEETVLFEQSSMADCWEISLVGVSVEAIEGPSVGALDGKKGEEDGSAEGFGVGRGTGLRVGEGVGRGTGLHVGHGVAS
jgi:hypothetical protein